MASFVAGNGSVEGGLFAKKRNYPDIVSSNYLYQVINAINFVPFLSTQMFIIGCDVPIQIQVRT